jgi:hypothetical protein
MTRRIGGVLVALVSGPAWALTASLITAPSLVNHLPGVDMEIGTGDDGVASGTLGNNASGPNTHGAASFALSTAPG